MAAMLATPWSVPATLPVADPPPRVEANEIDQAGLVPRVSAGQGGLMLASWRGGEGSRVLVALDGTRTVRVRTSRATAASERYARSRVLHFDARIVDPRENLERKQLGYRIGSAELSRFGGARTIGTPRSIRWAPQLAVNADGAAIAAWHHIRRGRSDEIQVAWRPAGGRFSAVRTVQSDGIDDEALVGVGIDTRGRAIVAYSRHRQLAVRVIQTRSGWMSAESRTAPPAGQRGPTEIAVGAGEPGQVVVAWRAYPVTEGPTGHVDAAAAVLPVGSNRLRPARALSEGNLIAYPRGPIRAAIDAAGRPVVAWSQPLRPGVSVPYVAQADRAGIFGAPQALDASGSIGALVRHDEGLAVGWLRESPGPEGHGDPLGVLVSLRGPDGPFGPGELVDDRTLGTSADGLQPPGLGVLPSGGLLAVYADLNFNAPGGQARASAR